MIRLCCCMASAHGHCMLRVASFRHARSPTKAQTQRSQRSVCIHTHSAPCQPCACACAQVLKRINAEIEARRKAGEDLPPPPKTAIAGPEYFGFNQPEVCCCIGLQACIVLM